MRIETFESGDREDWLKLWQAYLVFYKASLPDEIGEQAWERMIAPDGDISGFKAVDDDGRMIGMVTFLYHGSTWSAEPRCYLPRPVLRCRNRAARERAGL